MVGSSDPLGVHDACGAFVGKESIMTVPAPLRGLAAVVDAAERLQESMPAGAWDGLPVDGAENYKHYLYGPLREEG